MTSWRACFALTALAACSSDPFPQDAAAPRDASDASVVDACDPGDGESAAPAVTPQSAMRVCTAEELDAYAANCLDPASLPIRCQQFVAKHADCARCLSPAATGTGPLLAARGEVRLNVAGCVALVLGDHRPDGCGVREQNAIDCAESSCAACGDESVGCVARARSTACASVETLRCPELAGAAVCALDGSFAERFRRVAGVFCGGQ